MNSPIAAIMCMFNALKHNEEQVEERKKVEGFYVDGSEITPNRMANIVNGNEKVSWFPSYYNNGASNLDYRTHVIYKTY